MGNNQLIYNKKYKILFVCLGNICRSATADEVMRTLLRKEGLDKEIEVDSAGTKLIPPWRVAR